MTQLPLMKNCRVDYKEINGFRFSLLIDFTDDSVLFYKAGIHQLKAIYSEFKFMALNELPIDNCPYNPIEINKLSGVSYQYK